jgi:hypothetical protein
VSRSSLALVVLFAGCSCVPAERQSDEPPRRSDKYAKVTHATPALPGVSGDEPEPPPGDEPRQARAQEPSPALTETFTDEFERKRVGDDYFATSAEYRIENGRLCVQGARNHPLWLRRRLPKNARIQVEAQAGSPHGDIKLEAWGDGQAAATRISYTDATSYLGIFGGWQNRYHVLARLDEHAPDRPEVVIEPESNDPRRQPVRAGQRYRLKLERSDGRTLRFWVDDVEILSFSDPLPLQGTGHDHFAFNDWETPVCFDHLVVEPLPG